MTRSSSSSGGNSGALGRRAGRATLVASGLVLFAAPYLPWYRGEIGGFPYEDTMLTLHPPVALMLSLLGAVGVAVGVVARAGGSRVVLLVAQLVAVVAFVASLVATPGVTEDAQESYQALGGQRIAIVAALAMLLGATLVRLAPRSVTRTCSECFGDVPVAARRCMHCGSALPTAEATAATSGSVATSGP